MKHLFAIVFALTSITIYAQLPDREMSDQEIRRREAVEHVNYFKTHPIFVVQAQAEKNELKGLDDYEIIQLKLIKETFNRNLRIALGTFWDLSDTVVFVQKENLKEIRKKFDGGIVLSIFPAIVAFGKKMHVNPFIGFSLYRPGKDGWLSSVSGRAISDTTFLTLATELRLLKLNVTNGDVMNKRDLGRKIILINNDEKRNYTTEIYVDAIRGRFKGSIMEVDGKFIRNVLMKKDPKFIYVHDGATFNVEDGSVIPLL